MLHGVLDPQPGKLAFALFENGQLLRSSFLEMHPRDASLVPDFVESELAACGKVLQDVPQWTFGAGPGSFTFLRVVAALGAGWAAGNPAIRFRCIPGALALAGKLDPGDGETVAILYDGRNKELLAFEVKKVNGTLQATGKELILNADAAKQYFSGNPMKLAAFEADKEALIKVLGNGIPFTTVTPDLAVLANAPGEFDNETDRMCYIRPAVNA